MTMRHMTRTGLLALAGMFFLAGTLLLAGGVSRARAGGTAGDFDLYVLSLSWSPEYCASQHSNQTQCAPERHLGLVVHGLWPQYETARNGADWPSSCPATQSGRPTKQDVTTVFPTAGLFRHEWREHGVCSGLTPDDYLALTGRLRDKVQVPDALQPTSEDRGIPAADLRQALVAANPGLPPDGLVLDCKGNRLAEIRLCFAKDPDGTFRPCPAEMRTDRRGDCPRQIRIRGLP